MLPVYIYGRRDSEPSASRPEHALHHDSSDQKIGIANHVFQNRLNRFYKGKWEAALQEKWILTVTCGILFIGTTVIAILNVYTLNYAEASEDNVNLWWKIFVAEKNSGTWPINPDTEHNELFEWEEELDDLRQQITVGKETATLGIFLAVFTVIVNLLGVVAVVKENRDLLQWHGVTLGIDELMLMTLAGSLFHSSIRVKGSVNRLTSTYPTKGTCITKLVFFEGKCPVFLTLNSSARFSALAASLGAVLMGWVAIASDFAAQGLKTRKHHWTMFLAEDGHKPQRRNVIGNLITSASRMFSRRTSNASSIEMDPRKTLDSDDICTIEITPPNVAVLIEEEITPLPALMEPGSISTGSISSYQQHQQQQQQQSLHVPEGYRAQRKKSFTLIPLEDVERVKQAIARRNSYASLGNYPTTWETDEDAVVSEAMLPLTNNRSVSIAKYVQLYMTVLIGRQCKPGANQEESFVVTWYKDRLLPHKPQRRNVIGNLITSASRMFSRRTSNASSIEMDPRKTLDSDDICTIEITPPNVAVLIEEEITPLPALMDPGSISTGSISSYQQQQQQQNLCVPEGYRAQRKKSFTLIPLEDVERVKQAIARRNSYASLGNYPTTWETDEDAVVSEAMLPLTNNRSVSIAKVHYEQ
ncbi:unnamed protein product [Notodromas monacha]|uniref:Uncharacterized protein n=1 Tax=Notodromas monacha TaxID=399045 RepID=A0A7R9BWK2_9CRUS|nr:unnamed protein product [Notodromas monacha]CAG0923054.1 unnamed protein product [Notodromas monacha]